MKLTYPFAVISDIHCMDWSQFSYVMEDGVNSRLNDTLAAIAEAVLALKKAGGNDLVITGDLFHTRGKMKPSVFNPVVMLFKEIVSTGVRVFYFPGNHDLEFKECNEVGDAAYALSSLEGWHSFHVPTSIDNAAFIPWIESKDEFLFELSLVEPKDKILFAHIGMDGVLDDVRGKVSKAVFERGFKYVFCGDYHEHKHLGSGIYSVGALTHHNFGDVGKQAGYLIVHEDRVEQHETKAPKFLTWPVSKRDCYNNFVRITGELTQEEADKIKKAASDYGAKVVDQSTRPSVMVEAAVSKVKVDLGLDAAIESYATTFDPDLQSAILEEAKRVRECSK